MKALKEFEEECRATFKNVYDVSGDLPYVAGFKYVWPVRKRARYGSVYYDVYDGVGKWGVETGLIVRYGPTLKAALERLGAHHLEDT